MLNRRVPDSPGAPAPLRPLTSAPTLPQRETPGGGRRAFSFFSRAAALPSVITPRGGRLIACWRLALLFRCAQGHVVCVALSEAALCVPSLGDCPHQKTKGDGGTTRSGQR